MKRLALLLLLVSGTASAAQPIVIAEKTPGRHSLREYRWKINPELGRAWVELHWRDSRACTKPGVPNCGLSWKAAQVPGLSYDAASQQIVHDQEGRRVSCAKIAFAGSILITPTGECSVSTVVGTRPVDDGFEVKPRRVLMALFHAR